jgi:Ribbon-helix-helix protein, copG family
VHHDGVRTTITIDDHLLDEVRQVAAARRQTVSKVIEEFVRESLLRSSAARRAPIVLRPFQAGGYQVGVDLDDNAGLLELMDE